MDVLPLEKQLSIEKIYLKEREMTAINKPRVFLLTDYFTRSKDYYLVADNEEDAVKKGNSSVLTYDVEHDEEFESTEVQEEVTLLLLTRITPQPDQPQQVCLLPVEVGGTDAYHGYEIEANGYISAVLMTYPKSEWRLDE